MVGTAPAPLACLGCDTCVFVVSLEWVMVMAFLIFTMQMCIAMLGNRCGSQRYCWNSVLRPCTALVLVLLALSDASFVPMQYIFWLCTSCASAVICVGLAFVQWQRLLDKPKG